MLLLPAVNAQAIITVDDDYLIYDTRALGDTSVAKQFSFQNVENVSFVKTDNVIVKLNLKWGRSISDPEAMGFYVGYPYQTGSTLIGGIQIGETASAPYVYKTADWEALTGDDAAAKTAYRWWYNQPEDSYNRPSDSLIVRVPADIDSILIEGGGSNTGYGIIAYELDGGFDNGYYNAGNYGKGFARIGFKPVNYGNKDSVDIVILGAFKDWFIPLDRTEWTDGGSIQFKTVNISESANYNKGERWGRFSTATLNRIKVYGKIQKSETPEFNGTLSEWTFKYMPLPSGTGTPNANELAPDDGSMQEASNLLANDEGCVRSILRAAPGMGNMQLGKECGEVQNAKLANIGCNDTLYNSWAAYDKYFQIDFNSTDYNNINLSFDFNLRGSSDSLVLLYSTNGKDYFLWSKYATTDAFDGLVNVSTELPLGNCASARVRLLPDHTDIGDGYPSDGELILANVRIDSQKAANAVESVKAQHQSRIFSQAGVLYIELEQAEDIRIYNILGQPVCKFKGKEGLNSVDLNQSLYIIGVGKTWQKVNVK